MQRMVIKLENVGIAVRDLEATIAFFTDLGLTVIDRETVSGEWTDTAVGLDGNHAKITMLQTVTVDLSSSSTFTPKRSNRSPLVPTRLACTALPSQSTTSTKPLR
jgi:catechol 2,3-dioxygenase-like lactoylglutathione lyase family enzyme